MAKTPVVPAATLRIRVRTRSGRPLQGVPVSIDSPALSANTDANGFVKLGLTDDQLKALEPSNQITLHAKKRHHGPDPGPGNTIVSGEIKLTPTVGKTGFDAATPGLDKDKTGAFLNLVLMDAGFNFGVASPAGPTRRLTDDLVQKELLFLQSNGDVALTADSEFVFDHDPTSGEFDPCDPTKCTLKSPAANRRVSVQKATIAGVKFLMLMSFAPSPANAKTDQIPGHRFARDRFGWANMTLALLDQRHVVGLARMCKDLKTKHGIAAIVTQGVSGDTSRADTHGFGQAIDFGGCCKILPDDANKNPTVRLGTDFIVLLHWGNFPMWNGVSVRANPTNPALWTRLAVNDDGRDYTADPTGAIARLHYRLDPAPFQEPVPAALAAADPVQAALLAGVAPHFVTARALFQDIYDFATREYSDGNSTLGLLPPTAAPDVPTPIDSHLGHFILHPDYPHPNAAGAKNGRQAHVNHLHIQVGPTSFPGPRTT